jgi:LysR family transcriptional regulator, transcription activator of glutamate synthase operon
MELYQLRYFEAVARYQHVTEAARELHIAQPSLSKQIQQLERDLGVKLFNRVGRRVELTDAGALLLPYARRVLREVDDARVALRRRSDLTIGHVSIGAPPTVGTHLLPGALAAFNERYRGIQLELHEAGAGQLVDLLSHGTVDLAVVPLPVSEVACAELFTEELVVAVAQHHPLAARAAVQSADLAHEDFILFPSGYELRERTLDLCRAAGFMPRVVLDGGEMDTVLRLAAVGLGITIVPRLALEGNADLVGLPIADVRLQRTLGLIWHPERELSPATTALQDFLTKRLSAN